MTAEKFPSISVVIPCFRAGRFLADAIQSVLSQTEKDWELILVDNNASEDTREIIEKYATKYPEKIKAVHEKRQGNSFARNRGLAESRGAYIALLDDDDLMYPERLSLQKEALERHTEAVLCFGRIDRVSFDNTTIFEADARATPFSFFMRSSGLDPLAANLRFWDPLPSSVMLRRKVARMIGGFDEHFNPCFLEETDFYFRIFQIGFSVEIPQTVIRFRMSSPEFLRKKRIDIVSRYRLLLNQDYFFSKIKNFLQEKRLLDNALVRQDLSRWKARWLREASFDFMGISEGLKFARILLKRSIKENPLDLKSWKHYLRSYLPLKTRQRRYRSLHVYEEGIPNEITEDFINSLFSGDHHCPFCHKDQISGSIVAHSSADPGIN